MRQNKENSILSQINVTPFVDVMLVLLVVFMIVAPMVMPGVDIDLPVVNSNKSKAQSNVDVTISVTKQGHIYLQDLQVKLLDIKGKIQEKHGQSQVRIFIRGDKDAPYETIVGVLAYLKDSGFAKISLVTSIN